MAGGLGGRQTTSTQVPAWLETAARQTLGRADDVSQIGYVPYYGPDVAALTPMQQASMQNTSDAASAFGMASSDPMAGMPTPQTFAGGVQGYSSAPLYQQSLDALAEQRPGQFDAINSMFIDPTTGQRPSWAAEQAPGVVQNPGGQGGKGGGPVDEEDYQSDQGQPPGNFSLGGMGNIFNGSGTGSMGLPDPMSGRITSVGRLNMPDISGLLGGN